MQTDSNTHNDSIIGKTKVFDLPTRLFHWIFAALFICAFAIGKFTDDEAALYPIHMMLGILMVLAVFLRLIWGIFGTKYARLCSFNLNPANLISYFGAILNGTKRPSLGRNPASSWAAIIMIAFAILMGFTGYQMATSASENHDIKEIHETIAIIFLLVALLHIGGIILHTITQKDPIGLAMISGKKTSIEGQTGIKSNRIIWALVFAGILSAAGFAMAQNYTAQTRTLSVFGQTLQLGENEEDEEHEKGYKSEESGENEAKEEAKEETKGETEEIEEKGEEAREHMTRSKTIKDNDSDDK